MSRRRHRLVLGALAAVASWAWASRPAAGQDAPMLLAGSDRAVWLVRRAPRRFDVLVRPVGKKWQWIARDVYGEPSTVAATGSHLDVLLRKPGHIVFHMGLVRDTTGLDCKPSDPRWPKGAMPLALCSAPAGFGKAQAPPLVGVVAYKPKGPSPATSPAATGPATQPTTRPPAKPRTATGSRPAQPYVHLAVFHTANPERKFLNPRWVFLTELRDVLLPAETRIFVAALADTLYMLICPPGGPNRLAYWKTSWKPEQPWESIALQGPAAKGHVLGMLPLRDRLTILAAMPTREAPGTDEPPHAVHITGYEGPQRGFADQLVTRKDKPATWPPRRLPLVAAMGEQVALLWLEDAKPRFATCGPDGKIVVVSDVDVLEQPPLDNRGPAILEKLLWGLVGGVLFSMFLLRPRTPSRSFVSVPHLVPAPLARRLLAFLADMVLVQTLALLVFSVTSGPMDRDELQRIMQSVTEGRAIPARFAYGVVASTVSLAAYGFFMERRFGGTAGKLLFRLRVVGLDGLPLGLREAALRNLVKVFELIPVLWPMLLVPLFNRSRLRLGDILGRTIVVESHSVLPPGSRPSDPGKERPPNDADRSRRQDDA